jgi:3-deoxy-D-manno-octulosonic acid kinase
MINGGQRIATAKGVMLADPNGLGNALAGDAPTLDAESLFDPKYWAARGELAAVSAGRGSAWFVGSKADPWVLRHYRRGGWIARITEDRYTWLGEERVRAFAEWRLLEVLARRGLPVPKPIAAWYRREGLTYRCDLITGRIANAEALSAALATRALAPSSWRAIGEAVARLHASGVDHADLNAHNILLGGQDAVSVIDFDRGRLRTPGPWAAGNLRRLHRSLSKISPGLPPHRFSPADWQCFLDGYRAAGRTADRTAG